jgi:ribonuclease R
MAGREGEEFPGIITGVTSFGIFVEMTELMVEGLVRLVDLHDDYYEYHEKEHMLLGKRHRKIFRLGSPMKVRVKHVDILKKEITLEPADDGGRSVRGAGGKRGKNAGGGPPSRGPRGGGGGGRGRGQGKGFKKRPRRAL